MVKLRLSRFGHKNSPFYRIVAANAKSKRNGNALDYCGTYDPLANPSKAVLKKDKILAWLKDGAIPTPTVKAILIKEGVLKKEAKVVQKVFKGKPGKKKTVKAAAEAKK
jgi:small subunit ribosomal protein S16